jgi:hypothetical protein
VMGQIGPSELLPPIVDDGDMYEIARWGLADLRDGVDVSHLPNWYARG